MMARQTLEGQVADYWEVVGLKNLSEGWKEILGRIVSSKGGPVKKK